MGIVAKVLVTGGTGILGRHVAVRLAQAGYEVRALTEHRAVRLAGVRVAPGNLLTGEGLKPALSSVETIVHCPVGRADAVGTRRLLDVAAGMGVRRLLCLSRVGVDAVPLGAYQIRRRVERLVSHADLDWAVLRVTPTHQALCALFRRLATSPVIPVPDEIRLQPVDAHDVAEAVADALATGARGRLPDLGGPQVRGLEDLLRSYLEFTGRRRPVLRVPPLGRVAAALRAGAQLTRRRDGGQRTFEDALRAEVGNRAARGDRVAWLSEL